MAEKSGVVTDGKALGLDDLEKAYANVQNTAMELEKELYQNKVNAAFQTSAKAMTMLGSVYCKQNKLQVVDFVEDSEPFLEYVSRLLNGEPVRALIVIIIIMKKWWGGPKC